MQILFELGINENDIRAMIEMNPDIVDLTEEELNDRIKILKNINCTDRQIKNIISSNSVSLSKSNDNVINLINYLTSKGFKSLNILFDSNPYVLNLDVFEIDNYINSRLDNGDLLEDIIDDLDSNPHLFNEI